MGRFIDAPFERVFGFELPGLRRHQPKHHRLSLAYALQRLNFEIAEIAVVHRPTEAVHGEIAQERQVAFEVEIGPIEPALIPDGLLGRIGIAERIPPARFGTVEIRPVMEIGGLPEN